MNEEKRCSVPNIRFNGFETKWKQQKLGECVLIQRGGSPRPIENYITHDPNGINWIKIGDVKKGSRYITKTDEKIKPEGISKSREVYKGDLILSNSMSFGRPYLLAIDGCIHDGWLLIRNDRKLFDLDFLLQLLSSEAMAEQYRSLAAGGVVNNLNSALVQSTNIAFPDKAEQTKIGDYFRELDQLIELHQGKHEKLLALKKAMLQKMFPQPGADTPEIRFKGFTGDWVESSLSSAADITTGFPFKSSEFSETGTYLVITNGNIQNELSFVDASVGNRISIQESSGLSQFILLDGDILVTMDGSVGRTAKVNCTNQILAQRVGRLVAKTDSEFLYQALNTGAFLEKMTAISHGGTIKHISLSEIGNYVFLIPSEPNEQQKIGAYFRALDELISKHGTQLQKLKQIKSACLEKMFV